jgi:hypothetical protein
MFWISRRGDTFGSGTPHVPGFVIEAPTTFFFEYFPDLMYFLFEPGILGGRSGPSAVYEERIDPGELHRWAVWEEMATDVQLGWQEIWQYYAQICMENNYCEAYMVEGGSPAGRKGRL